MYRTLVTTLTGLALTATGAATGASAYAAPHAGHVAQAARPYSVTVGVNNDAPELGQTIKLKGKVTPAAPRESVRLEVKYADQKKWKSLGTQRLTSHSSFLFKDKIGSVRERKYRVVKAGSGGHAGATSANVKVVSYGWRTLTSLTPVANTGISEVGNVAMNGVSYADSLLQYVYAGTPNPGTTGYNLNRDCLELTARAGLSDTSPINGSAAVSVAADGVQEYAGTFGLTQSADVSVDLTDAFRVTVSSTSTNGGLGALGSPMVLCSF